MIQLSGKIMEPCKVYWACGGKKICSHIKLARLLRQHAEAAHFPHWIP